MCGESVLTASMCFRGPVEVWIVGFGCRQACRRSVDVQRVGLEESVFTPGKRVGGL